MRGLNKAHLVVVVAACLAFAASGVAQATELNVRVEPRDASVVLYTIYRGSYDQIGPAIGKLFGLAAQKGITPQGPVTFCYLNNPQETTPEHYLTEIRIPVTEDALKQAGTLGEMTDIKRLPATEVAVVEKPVGEPSPAPMFLALFKWTRDNDYEAVGGPMETFAENAQGGDYAQMQTLIAIPVQKLDGK